MLEAEIERRHGRACNICGRTDGGHDPAPEADLEDGMKTSGEPRWPSAAIIGALLRPSIAWLPLIWMLGWIAGTSEGPVEWGAIGISAALVGVFLWRRGA